MMMKMTAALTLLLLLATSAMAVDTFNVQCLGWSGTGAGDLGTTGADVTSTTPHLQAPVIIATTDEEAFQCFLVVPDDYDDTSGTEPTITFMGWIPTASVCGSVPSCLANDLSWDVKSRDFADGDTTGNSWTVGGATNTKVMTDSACGMDQCWDADKIYVFTGDATGAASDWSPGQMAVIWVQRWDDLERYKGQFMVNGVAQITYQN